MTCQPPSLAPQPGVHRQAGLTLIEAIVTTAILAILLGMAVPSFERFTQRGRLEGAAAQLETDLQLLRFEAVARNETLRISFAQGAEGSCYVMHSGPANACRCAAGGLLSCDGGAEALRGAFLAAERGVQLVPNRASLAVDATRGTVTPTATMRLVSPAGEIQQVINIMGRVRSCSPGGTVPGYRVC